MARRPAPPAPDDFEEHVVDIDVGEEMRTSFLEYAYSVIYSRALPDARDGLKPVQRRILYTMADLNLRPDRGHVKSARVVGEVMGRLHPHGDGAIYDALVRQVQPWTMRLPMIDGHGNFGNLDDGPAAMRYTECRMAPPALAMTASIDEDTVEFKPNYDSRETEPWVLPAAIPNLLVNGASGIAVGMATNMAPHNLVEVVAALRHLISHPDVSLDELMRFVPGPDLPTAAKIVGLDGIRDAYASGRGSFRMRATARVEQVSSRRQGIVVTELPYGVGPEKVIERIKTLVQAKKLHGIAAVNDYSDRDHALRLVIEVKNGFHADALLEQLYKQTPMEDSFSINAVALVDGQPRTLGLKELLEVYLAHRRDVVRRRTTYRRGRAGDRLHLVEGLLVAILDIDEVIQLIRTSDDASVARERLMQVFDLSELQATHILDLPLRRLTRFSRIELEKEREELQRTIEALDAILADAALLDRTVADELAQMAEEYGTPAAHRAAGGGRADRHLRGAAGGGRRPLPGAPGRHRAAGPYRIGPARRRRLATLPPGPARRRRLGGRDHGTGGGRRGDEPRPGAPPRRARPAGAARHRARPAPAGRRAGRGVPGPGARRAGALPHQPAGRRHRCARRARCGPRPGHRSRRGQAGAARPPQQQGHLGGRPPRRR